MRKIHLLLISLFVLSGCLSLKIVSPIHREGKSYEIAKVQTVNLGSPMLTVFSLYVFPTYKPKYEFQPPNAGVNEMPPLKPGQRWVAFYSMGKNYIVRSKKYSSWAGIEIKPDGELGNKAAWINLQASPPVRMIQSSWKPPEPQLFIEVMGHKEYSKEGSFKAELLYNGISENTVLISYREYIDEMARPAFYQELRYDLEKSRMVTFRSLRIEILRATNQGITFKVLDDGGLPWVSR